MPSSRCENIPTSGRLVSPLQWLVSTRGAGSARPALRERRDHATNHDIGSYLLSPTVLSRGNKNQNWGLHEGGETAGRLASRHCFSIVFGWHGGQQLLCLATSWPQQTAFAGSAQLGILPATPNQRDASSFCLPLSHFPFYTHHSLHFLRGSNGICSVMSSPFRTSGFDSIVAGVSAGHIRSISTWFWLRSIVIGSCMPCMAS